MVFKQSYALDLAYDADEGLSNALTAEHDLIVLDRMLPGMIEGIDIAKKLADLHHGTIDVVSEPGKGSSFTVKIPTAERKSP